MSQRLLIALGAGLVAAVVFASATTGPLLMRMILFLLTSLPLFLAGLGAGPLAAAVAGIAGTVLVFVAGSPMAALLFAASQAIPVALLTYLAQLNRQTADGDVEWYPVGRLVIGAGLLAAAFSTLTLFLLGGDAETLRNALRDMLQGFVTAELQNMPDAPALGPEDVEAAADIAFRLLPAASAISTMGTLLFNMWLAGRITLASGHLARPWPDIPAMSFPPTTPLMLAAATGAGFLAGLPGLVAAAFAGALFFAYVLLGLAVVHYITRGLSWRPFALWGLYAALLIMNTLATVGIALLGLAETIWPLRKPPPGPPNPPPS